MYLENLGMIIAFDWTQGWTQHLMASLAPSAMMPVESDIKKLHHGMWRG